MRLQSQKRLAATILKISPYRVWIDPEKLTEVKEAITKEDIRSLIKDKIIRKKPKVGVSRGRARKKAVQKKKGRRKGAGSRKGKTTARLPRKKSWINKIRAQRKLLQSLKEKEKISTKNYNIIRKRMKGGFFRSRRHLKLYLSNNKLIKEKKWED